MKIYELIYIWDDADGYDLTETALLTDYTEVEKKIKAFCEEAENIEGRLIVKNANRITYDVECGYSTLYVKEHELCD